MELKNLSMRQLKNRLIEAQEQYDRTKSPADEKRLKRIEETIEYLEEKD